MNYPKSFVEKFLTYVERDPVLWDAKSELHGNSNAKNAGWEYISVQLNEKFKGGHASGGNLNNFWLSLMSIREDYNRDKGRIGYQFLDKMTFLEGKKNKKANILSLEDLSAFSVVQHVFLNLVFLGLFICMTVFDSFKGTFKDCRGSLYPLFFAWCMVTGLSSITAFCTVRKNSVVKNAPPTTMLALYAAICIATYVFNQPLPPTKEYYYRGHFREVQIITPKCPTEQTRFSYIIIGFLGFPLSVGLSFCYHFMKVTSRAACTSGWKMICAAYYGSAFTFLFFMATIDWHGSCFLFFIWMLVNAKFANDGVSNAWKEQEQELKVRIN